MEDTGHRRSAVCEIGQRRREFFTVRERADNRLFSAGRKLPSVTLAYETYGEAEPGPGQRDPGLPCPQRESQHAAGSQPRRSEGVGDLWTEECQRAGGTPLSGPARRSTPTSFFVVCANYLGGCYGSTGPSSINPATGKPLRQRLSRITLADIVDSQIHLLDHLGIEKLHAVTGGSLGGMMCMSLATRYPDRVRIVMPIASGLHHHACSASSTSSRSSPSNRTRTSTAVTTTTARPRTRAWAWPG